MYLQKENSVYNVLRSIKKHRSKHGMSRFFVNLLAENKPIKR